jgi:hypothetical protein
LDERLMATGDDEGVVKVRADRDWLAAPIHRLLAIDSWSACVLAALPCPHIPIPYVPQIWDLRASSNVMEYEECEDYISDFCYRPEQRVLLATRCV